MIIWYKFQTIVFSSVVADHMTCTGSMIFDWGFSHTPENV